DLRKLEAGRMPVQWRRTELDTLIYRHSEDFIAAADNQDISLSLNLPKSVPATKTDDEKVATILTNLLANALKYTPNGGSVELSLLLHQGTTWEISVADNGPGIPVSERERVFQRFVQLGREQAGGTGVGLALVKEFAELLGGVAGVTASSLGGSLFFIKIPHLPVEDDESSDMPPANPTAASLVPTLAAASHKEPLAAEEIPLVLIVEDDRDVAAYLAESLAQTYRTVVTYDGNNGWENALRLTPDLIISDVMMPGLNGLQLCARTKMDQRTSHIPVLLLTARTAVEHRLEGLERGADAYLTKPYAERELHLRLRNLLRLRQALMAQLQSQVHTAEAGAIDEENSQIRPELSFLKTLKETIHERLNDPDLTVSDLERAVGMSKSQLHRKLQSILGLSANRLINQIRLETAAKRLRNGAEDISTVAFDCGFSDPGYFGRRFRERYGQSPTAYRERAKQEEAE
ncbi:MAG: ATP-binding protein, partial [Bacteroidota bacterium]